MTRYDIAIIGTGPAGLSAALTAKNRNKNFILLGSKDLSSKMKVAHEVDNYLGLSKVSGEAMSAAFASQMTDMGIEIEEQKVTAVYALGDFFSLQTDQNELIEASSVILASGVVAGKPYPGEERLLGRGVSYCATCDAPLFRGKNVTVIGGSPKEEAEADFLREVCASVLYFPLYKGEPHFNQPVEVIHQKPVEILGDQKVSALKTDTGEYSCDAVFILREAQFPSQLVPGVEIEGNAVKVNLQMETNIKGLFAAGDVAGLPYQYIKAAGQGNVAALSAVNYLAAQSRK
ncbi:MAG: NAD(P)/FAD-dependent oxidoreductase [Erysipelotrichia bacterium]|nr:NAD(P)/FAD-dependent oxidoreductase [Erysipelotrichia bacterium]